MQLIKSESQKKIRCGMSMTVDEYYYSEKLYASKNILEEIITQCRLDIQKAFEEFKKLQKGKI